MTSTSQLLSAAGLTAHGVAPWGTRPSSQSPGVYLLAISEDPTEEEGLANAAIDPDAVSRLLRVRAEATVDGRQATEQSFTERLKALWVPGEPVVYIGLAGTSLAQRVGQYYDTKIGARAPHAGGWPIKMLANLNQLWVHYAACDTPDLAEQRLLRAFGDGLSAHAITELHDHDVVLPYANLELTKGRRKAHGFKGVKAPRTRTDKQRPSPRPSQAEPALATPVGTTAVQPKLVTNSRLRTQSITPTDIAGGRIRIPKTTKSMLPPEKGTIDLELCGELLQCGWDPKFGPDRERSGVISVPKTTLVRLVRPGRQLAVTVADGVVRIGEPT